MKPIVILTNGYPQSGKDTISEFAQEKYINIVKHSVVDLPKEFARKMGWDGSKTDANRLMLSELKDFYDKHFDGSRKDVSNLIKSVALSNDQIMYFRLYEDLDIFIFIDAREPSDIKMIKSICKSKGIKFYSVFVDREECQRSYGNHADDGVTNYIYDYYISNNDSLDMFKENVYILLDEMLK